MFTWYWLHTMRANDVRPYGLFGRVCCAAKSLRSLRIYICFGRGEAVQVYASMLVLFDVWVLCAFWICSAPLSRLTPIEALPQAPTGLCPVPFAIFARGCFYFELVIGSVWRCHSSLLT